MLENLRKEYSDEGINAEDLPKDPLGLLNEWIKIAIDLGVTEPNAMIISTVSDTGRPSTRTVLLKELDAGGLIFYTNYNSRKAREIKANPSISALFLWLDLERQVRIEGKGAKITPEESDEYFSSRPRLSQIGAWASPQSSKVSDRKELDANFRKYEKEFPGKVIRRPPHWGGIRIVPDYFEFWQGRTGRMHDRIVYDYKNEGYEIYRLAP
jgi:pyridoxamine 5'-phosphate oxidase